MQVHALGPSESSSLQTAVPSEFDDSAHRGRSTRIEDLPFGPGDVTVGVENELATDVSGPPERSEFLRALAAESHRLPWQPAASRWIGDAGRDIARVDHDWVRIPLHRLAQRTRSVLFTRLDARGDRARFLALDRGLPVAKVPVSYALELALIDALAEGPGCGSRVPGMRLCGIFANDNTAPEIVSSYVADDRSGVTLGAAAAEESALRFLLVQGLSAWITARFGMTDASQFLRVYQAPTAPERLQALARIAPSESYRRLLMNPCLGGFADGEAKAAYMGRCHETLSRARVVANGRIRAAGLGVGHALSTMPVDTTLLNNGVHVSLGSRVQADMATGSPSGARLEKFYGDIVSKLFEYFLPLFVGTYSAAPSWLPVAPLRPEHTLGLLPLQLTAPQLRRTWGAWKLKAGLLGAFRGDVVPDARLLDYFMALPSTDDAHAHDGRLGSQEALQARLEKLGIYDRSMAFYDLYRLRAHARMGYSGFEGRFHSLFPSFGADMAPAVDLQRLVTACAWWAIAEGRIDHEALPDDPVSQGERRQFLVHAAIGLTSVPVARDTRSGFLRWLVAGVRGVRVSLRHPTHWAVPLDRYCEALCDWMSRECAPVVEALGAHDLLRDARARCRGEGDASHRLMAAAGSARDAAGLRSRVESYYRDGLRVAQTEEGLSVLRSALDRSDRELARIAGVAEESEAFLQRARAALSGAPGTDDALGALVRIVAALLESRQAGTGDA